MNTNPRPTHRQCLWCRRSFPIRPGAGRKKVYCSVSCRQRAYERRSGLGVLPPPERLITRAGGPLAHLPNRMPAYESGGWAHEGGKVHALRPAGYAVPGERRATLCGILRAPNGRRFGADREEVLCQTCLRVAAVRPPARAMRPSSDLAAYRAQLDNVATRLGRLGIAGPADRPFQSAVLLFELLSAA